MDQSQKVYRGYLKLGLCMFSGDMMAGGGVVVIMTFVTFNNTTGGTFMDDDITLPVGFNGDWFHQLAALMGPVARVDINMFGIQAFRTMIRISIARNVRATMATGKIFNMAGEFSGHRTIKSFLKMRQNNHLDPRLSTG
jgi:hypothetical protein